MEYKLAKELKDKGFPQFDINTPCPACLKQNECKDGCGCEDDLYTPTLSELIEACGEDFGELVRQPDGVFVSADTGEHIGVVWQAYPSDKKYYESGECQKECCGGERGKTPEEAVAKLWIALQD